MKLIVKKLSSMRRIRPESKKEKEEKSPGSVEFTVNFLKFFILILFFIFIFIVFVNDVGSLSVHAIN